MTAPIHQTPSPVIDLAIALEESRAREAEWRALAKNFIDLVADANSNRVDVRGFHERHFTWLLKGLNLSEKASALLPATPDQTNE